MFELSWPRLIAVLWLLKWVVPSPSLLQVCPSKAWAQRMILSVEEGRFSVNCHWVVSHWTLEFLKAFRSEALPTLFRAISGSKPEVLRLLTVTTIACLSWTPHDSPPPVTHQDHCLPTQSAHAMLHLPQASPVLCNCFCKIILINIILLQQPLQLWLICQQSLCFYLYWTLAISLTFLFLVFCLKKTNHSWYLRHWHSSLSFFSKIHKTRVSLCINKWSWR